MANKELMKEIAGRLREWWGPRKIKELAEKTGIPYSSVAAMMTGELQQSAELLRFVAENGGDVNWILTGKRREGEWGCPDSETLAQLAEDWPDVPRPDRLRLANEARVLAAEARAKKDALASGS